MKPFSDREGDGRWSGDKFDSLIWRFKHPFFFFLMCRASFFFTTNAYPLAGAE